MDFAKIRYFLFFGLLGAVTIMFLFILRPFFYPLFWAAILASVFYPFYKWLNEKIKVPNLSSIITVTLIAVIIVLPIIGIGSLVVKESINLYSKVADNSSQLSVNMQEAIVWLKNSAISEQLNINEKVWTEKFSELTKTVTNFLLNSAKDITQNSLIFSIMFVITFYALFFFVRDGKKLLVKLMHLCPLGDKYEKILYIKFTSTVRATIKGSLIIGLIQGTLGGIMFWVAGIDGALIWGLLMVLLAAVPGIGAYFIWLPAAVVMLIAGKTLTGIGMMLFGGLVIGTIDNLLRPILVGQDTEMHPLMVLFATLGGIVVFGISGFIIGPVIASLMLAFWEMYDEYFKKDLDHNTCL
jgi:predicted PurR-regulated permease PerM